MHSGAARGLAHCGHPGKILTKLRLLARQRRPAPGGLFWIDRGVHQHELQAAFAQPLGIPLRAPVVREQNFGCGETMQACGFEPFLERKLAVKQREIGGGNHAADYRRHCMALETFLPSWQAPPAGGHIPTTQRDRPMASTLDFYFEFSSPYGYMAATQIEALAAETGLALSWHPILLGPMFKAMGSAPLIQIPLKGEYALRDFARCAKLAGIPYSQPEPFPIATVAAARAAIHARDQHADKATGLIKALYHAYFADGRLIS